MDKFKSKETEKNNKIRNSTQNIKNVQNAEITQNKEKNTEANMIKLKLSSKRSKKDRFKSLSKSNNNNKRKPMPEPKYSYKDLGIPNPQDFNYETYKKDWCRYCGTRFSGSFTKGPWYMIFI